MRLRFFSTSISATVLALLAAKTLVEPLVRYTAHRSADRTPLERTGDDEARLLERWTAAEVTWCGAKVLTGINKEAVCERLPRSTLTLTATASGPCGAWRQIEGRLLLSDGRL